MKNARDMSEDLLRKLPLPNRVDTRMECFREVADLDFSTEQPEVQEALFLVEQTTPEPDRTAFRKCRDTIVVTNILLQSVVDKTYQESNRLMGQIAGLLTVMTVANDADLRERLQCVSAKAEGANGGALSPDELMGDPEGLLIELNRFGGAMFHCDIEYGPYWEEHINGEPEEWTTLDVMDSDVIGNPEYSPIASILRDLSRQVLKELQRPKALLRTIYHEPKGYLFSVGNYLIPWVEQQVDKLDDFAASLGSSAIVGGTLPDVTIVNPTRYKEKLRNPRSDSSLHDIIFKFRKWAYMGGDGDASIEWRPWVDWSLEYISSRQDRPREEVMALLRPSYERAAAIDEGRADPQDRGMREMVERVLEEKEQDDD